MGAQNGAAEQGKTENLVAGAFYADRPSGSNTAKPASAAKQARQIHGQREFGCSGA